MLELLLFIIVFYIGFQIGIFYIIHQFRNLFLKVAKDNGLDISNKEKDSLEGTHSKLLIEYNGNIMYLYDIETNAFICQGKTIEDLARFAKEYKNISKAIVVDPKSDNLVTFFDGHVV